MSNSGNKNTVFKKKEKGGDVVHKIQRFFLENKLLY